MEQGRLPLLYAQKIRRFEIPHLRRGAGAFLLKQRIRIVRQSVSWEGLRLARLQLQQVDRDRHDAPNQLAVLQSEVLGQVLPAKTTVLVVL